MPKGLKIPKRSRAKARLAAPDFAARGFCFEFSKRTYVMGVLNVTPDSFSDGGLFFDADRAVQHAMEMFHEGADIIDIGGESTRPGAAEVTESEEIDRVVPVIERLAKAITIPISVDTRKAGVAAAALEAGACIVNDVSGLAAEPQIAGVAAKYGAGLIVMHMKGTPQTMQLKPSYQDVMAEIIGDLRRSIAIAKKAGLPERNIIVDPGIGFGKNVEHNLEILNRLEGLSVLKRPVCVGTSRKSFIGKLLGIDNPAERLSGTLATCAIAIMKGARLLRVHDVKEAFEVARMTDSVLRGRP